MIINWKIGKKGEMSGGTHTASLNWSDLGNGGGRKAEKLPRSKTGGGRKAEQLPTSKLVGVAKQTSTQFGKRWGSQSWTAPKFETCVFVTFFLGGRIPEKVQAWGSQIPRPYLLWGSDSWIDPNAKLFTFSRHEFSNKQNNLIWVDFLFPRRLKKYNVRALY